jgi:glucuronate isomerase
MPSIPWTLSSDRCFDANPARRAVARELYARVEGLPLVSPHGHVPLALLADPEARLGTPAELFIIPDHYVFRMLYSQGMTLEDLGVQTRDGTPSGLWLAAELVELFGVEERLDGEGAQRIYDHLEAQIARPEFAPRALLDRFGRPGPGS